MSKVVWMLGGVLVVQLMGCADLKRRESNGLFEQGRYTESVQVLQQALSKDPQNTILRTGYLSRKAEAASRLLSMAGDYRAQGKTEEAKALASRVFEFDAGNERTKAFLADVERDVRHQTWLEQAQALAKKDQLDRALLLLDKILTENVKHRVAGLLKSQLESARRQQLEEQTLRLIESRPVSLEFRDANLKMIFEVLARHSGINFILDKDVKPDALATIFLRNAQIEDVLDVLASTNQLNKKVLNSKTVLIYPNTPDKQREYQDLVVKSFFLANAEAKTLSAQLKGMLKLKDMVVDDKLNVIVMRDTPEAIKVAERVIALLDMNEPEVMLEVEVLEINRNRLYELGVNFPSQFSFSPLPPSGSQATVNFLRNINGDQVGVGFASPTVNLRGEAGDVNTLANPRIRVKNKEKAKVLIGERLPVVSTTTTASGFVAESIQYAEVGIKLEVEPVVSLDDEVGIKVALEVSSVSNQVRTSSGSLAYQIGTRNANTVLKLRDGETQVLAGLISNAERSSVNRIPGFGDIPLVGRLFGSTLDNSQKTEILLSITPRLVRNIRRPDITDGEFWSGTEAKLGLKPIALPVRNKPDEPAANAEAPKALDESAAKKDEGRPQPTAAPSLAPVESQAEQKDTRTGGVTSKAPRKIELIWQGATVSKVNEPNTVYMALTADGALRGLPMQIGFDPSLIQVLDVKEGDFFKQENGGSSFSFQVAENKVLVGLARNGMSGVFGNERLIGIQYRLLKDAPAEFRVLQASALGDGPMPTVMLPPPLKVSSKP